MAQITLIGKGMAKAIPVRESQAGIIVVLFLASIEFFEGSISVLFFW